MGKGFVRSALEMARVAEALGDMGEMARMVQRAAQTQLAAGSAIKEVHDAIAPLQAMADRVVRRYTSAILALGGDPRAAVWDNWTLTDLEDAAAVAKRLRARYGAQVAIAHGAPDAPPRGRPRKMTKAKDEKLMALYRAGASRKRIATAIEVSESTVTRRMTALNLKFS